MITVSFEKRGNKGLCEYLYESLKTQILDGTLRANEKLPSKRILSEHLGVSVITVQNAYSLLISEGYIYSIEKKGFFVTELEAISSGKTSETAAEQAFSTSEPQKKTDWLADFSSNSTSYEKFPFALWAHTMRQVLNSGDERLLQRTELKGVYELRKAIAKYLKQFRNMNIDPSQIIISAGTEILYSMAVQFLGQNNKFALENPGYHKISNVLTLNGASFIPVDIDKYGFSVENLEKTDANIIHVSPAHHFPTGIVMPVKRRQEILSWAQKAENRFIIEDDYDSEFRFNGKPLPTLQSADAKGKVIYINTFSKTLAPSFRISYMVLPAHLTENFEKSMYFYSCPVSSFEQYTLAEFIEQGFYEKHLIRMKNFYRNLRNSFISLMESSSLSKICKITEEESGLHFLLSVHTQHSDEELSKRLLEQNINMPLLNKFYYTNVPDSEEKTFVLNYSGIKKERLTEIVRRLEKALL